MNPLLSFKKEALDESWRRMLIKGGGMTLAYG